MAYYLYLDSETKAELDVCDYADLPVFAAEFAREGLSFAYGDPEGFVPDFESISPAELDNWCDVNGVLFEANAGRLHWCDAADSLTQRHYVSPDTGDELFTFADLPDDEARRNAVYWLYEESCFAEIWDSSDPDDIPLDVAREVSNFYERLWDCSGMFSFLRTECRERD